MRAEEWINAFNYGYEFPRHDDSFSIQTDIIPIRLTAGCTWRVSRFRRRMWWSICR